MTNIEVGLIVGIAVSVFVTVKSFRQTKAIQRKLQSIERIKEREEKNRLLDEIIGWANAVIDCGPVLDTTEQTGDELAIDQVYTYDVHTLAITRHELLAPKQRVEDIRDIASNFRQELKSAVRMATSLLEQHLRMLNEFSGDEVTAHQLGMHRYILIEVAKHVIEEAARIKLREMHKM